MRTIEYWRCPSCSRILAENVVVGEIGWITATCWGCGESTTINSSGTLKTSELPIFTFDPTTVVAEVLPDGPKVTVTAKRKAP